MSDPLRHARAYDERGLQWGIPDLVLCTGTEKPGERISTMAAFPVTCPACLELLALPRDSRPFVESNGKRTGYKRARR